jgi:uncharacterized membrane protein
VSYRETLPEAERHLLRRLEAFGDIVIGFSMSQLAFQLTPPSSPADFMHPVRLLVYFGTFAALAALWYNFHRILSGAFRPTRVDMTLAFVYLAFTTIVPIALYANVHFSLSRHLDWLRWGVGIYVGCFVGTSLPGAIISWRSFRRGYRYFDEAERAQAWKRIVSVTTVAAYLSLTLVVDLAVPINLLWGIMPPSAALLSIMGVVIWLSTTIFGNRIPTDGDAATA